MVLTSCGLPQMALATAPREAGTLLYLLDVTDQGPDSCLNTWLSWLDGRPDTTQKSCPLAEGMGCRNMKMLYEATSETFYRDWSLNILNSLEIFAHPYTQEGRPTATYCWNAYNVCVPYCPAFEWLKADSGVISDATGVATWKDQSGNLHHASRVKGTMYHTTRTFRNGSHDVIRFNKDGFFSVLYGGSLNLQDLTVYAVVEQTGTERRGYFSNYSNAVNWGYGYLSQAFPLPPDITLYIFFTSMVFATYYK